MRGLTLALWLAATPLQAQVSAGAGTSLTALERSALEELGEPNATTFELVDSWFSGRPIQYYDLGRDAARPGILNAPIVPQGSRLDRDPAERMVRGAWYQGHRISYYDLGLVSAFPSPSPCSCRGSTKPEAFR